MTGIVLSRAGAVSVTPDGSSVKIALFERAIQLGLPLLPMAPTGK
jgi:hypothetical protein